MVSGTGRTRLSARNLLSKIGRPVAKKPKQAGKAVSVVPGGGGTVIKRVCNLAGCHYTALVITIVTSHAGRFCHNLSKF